MSIASSASRTASWASNAAAIELVSSDRASSSSDAASSQRVAAVAARATPMRAAAVASRSAGSISALAATASSTRPAWASESTRARVARVRSAPPGAKRSVARLNATRGTGERSVLEPRAPRSTAYAPAGAIRHFGTFRQGSLELFVVSDTASRRAPARAAAARAGRRCGRTAADHRLAGERVTEQVAVPVGRQQLARRRHSRALRAMTSGSSPVAGASKRQSK